MRMQQNSGRMWWIIGSVAGVLLLAGLAAGYFYWQSQQAETETSSKSSGEPLSLSVVDPPSKQEEYVSTPAKELAAEFNKQFVGKTSEPSISGPFGKVGEFKFFVRNDNYYGVAAVGTKDQAASNLALVRSSLKQQGYKETVRQKGSETESFDALYTGNNVLCEAYDRKPAVNAKKAQYETGILCSDFQKFKETSELIEPYVKAYQNTSSADVSNLGFYGLRVTSSPESGYRRAALNVTGENQDVASGYLLVFYQLPDGVWRYFTSTQGLVACSKYNTPELVSAFKGEPCEKGGQASRVE